MYGAAVTRLCVTHVGGDVKTAGETLVAVADEILKKSIHHQLLVLVLVARKKGFSLRHGVKSRQAT